MITPHFAGNIVRVRDGMGANSFHVLCPLLTLHPLSLFSVTERLILCFWSPLVWDYLPTGSSHRASVRPAGEQSGLCSCLPPRGRAGLVALGWPCPVTEGLCSSCHSRNHSFPLDLEVVMPLLMPTPCQHIYKMSLYSVHPNLFGHCYPVEPEVGLPNVINCLNSGVCALHQVGAFCTPRWSHYPRTCHHPGFLQDPGEPPPFPGAFPSLHPSTAHIRAILPLPFRSAHCLLFCWVLVACWAPVSLSRRTQGPEMTPLVSLMPTSPASSISTPAPNLGLVDTQEWVVELSDGAQGESLGWGHRSLCTSLASFWNALSSYSCLEKPFSSSETQAKITSSRKPPLTQWSGSCGASDVPQQLLPGSVCVARRPWSRTNPHQCFSLVARHHIRCMLDT